MHLGCSSWTWTGICDDARNPLSDVISNSVLGRSNSVFARYISLRVFCLAKTEFDLHKTEFEMTSLRGFLASSQITVYVQLLHPQVHHRFSKGFYKICNKMFILFVIYFNIKIMFRFILLLKSILDFKLLWKL